MATDLSAKIGVKALVSWEVLSSSVVGNVLDGNRHICKYMHHDRSRWRSRAMDHGQGV